MLSASSFRRTSSGCPGSSTAAAEGGGRIDSPYKKRLPVEGKRAAAVSASRDRVRGQLVAPLPDRLAEIHVMRAGQRTRCRAAGAADERTRNRMADQCATQQA